MAFRDKVVLITFAGSDIGKACADHFHDHWADLVLVDRNVEKLEGTVKKIKKLDPEAPILIISADIVTDAKRIIDETIKKYKRLDVLINNSDYGDYGTIETTSMETYDALMNTNTRAVLELTQLATPHLIKVKGNIVNVSSVCGMRAFTNRLAYSMSKAALDQFTRCVALELAPKGVRVNSVNPGAIINEFHSNTGMSGAQYKAHIQKTSRLYPLQRVGKSQEVVEAIAFLASDKGSFITGTCMPIDGGISISSPH